MKLYDRAGTPIHPQMFGLFFEDINFAADGGLYAEMIENRSFEAVEAHGTPTKFYAVDDYGYGWNPVCDASGEEPRMQYVTGTPVSVQNPHYLRITTTASGQGFSNKAYDGIYLRRGVSYQVSFYVRIQKYEGKNFTVAVKKEGKTYAQASAEAVMPIPYVLFSDAKMEIKSGMPEMDKAIAEVRAMDETKMCRANEWVKYELTLQAEEEVRGAGFEILLDGAGIVEFDLISMMPEDAVAGIFRRDLFEMLQDMKPGFIRFPGGCIVEGISLANRYQWKNTVGRMEDRKYIPNLWAFDDDRFNEDPDVMRPDAHYGQSFGIGFYEYFLLCELLNARPLPVLSIGAACEFRSTEVVPIDSKAFDTYVQDALDLIEFANGKPDTKWGSLRAKMGHPESFDLSMLAIGNEQWETKQVDLYARYEKFETAIHEKYPEMKLIGTAGPFIFLPFVQESWDYYRRKTEENNNFCYAVDEHYYMPTKWMYENVDFYDTYPRGVKVFAGEYAANTEKRENNMESALAEAAFMTGLEKNAGVVELASYAPLFNRIGHSQWTPDLIWFDDTRVYPTPNYYVQKLFANHVGEETIPMNGEEKPLREQGIYLSLSRTKDETILKAVNASDTDYELALTDEKDIPIVQEAKMYVLHSTKTAERNMPEPSEIEESFIQLDGKVKLYAKSFSVIRW